MTAAAAVDPIHRRGFFKNLVDNMEIGVIISDTQGKIIYINRTYARFLNIDIAKSL